MSSLMACIAGMALDADHWKLDFDTGKVAARIL